jgi:phosphoribosyl 1,2-cyclic phosphate phosphodiesterase
MVFLGTGTSVGVPVIGCGCATCASMDPRNSRLRCGLVLGLAGGNLLVDTPPDLRTQLLREKIGLVHATLYTHDHADHVFGLDDLRLFPYYLGHPMPVYCEDMVEARIRKSFDYAFEPAPHAYAGGVPQIEFRRITTEPFEVLSVGVIPLRLAHGKFRVLGFRFGNVAYCTDTNGIPPESLAQLEGLDVLVLDALRLKPHPTHFSLDEAVEVARRLKPKRTLFTHMSHDLEHAATNASLPPGMELAYDGLRIPLT